MDLAVTKAVCKWDTGPPTMGTCTGCSSTFSTATSTWIVPVSRRSFVPGVGVTGGSMRSGAVLLPHAVGCPGLCLCLSLSVCLEDDVSAAVWVSKGTK